MADNKNAAPEEMFNDDGTKNPEYKPPAGSESDANTKKEVGAEGKENNAEGEESFNDTIDDKNPPKIPVRLNVAQHIIARKDETIKKLRSKSKEEEADDTASDEDEEEDTSDDTRETINSTVQKAVAPLLSKLATDADEKEIKDLITAEPEAGKYQNHIRAYMAHEAWKGVPPSAIYHHLAWTAAKAIGAQKKKAADLEAKQGRGGGRSIPDNGRVDGLPTPEEIEGMSEADFEKMEQDARQGKFLKR